MRQPLRMAARAVLVTAGLLGAAASMSPAQALIVTPNPSVGEPSLFQIMNNLYGAGNYVQLDNSVYQHNGNDGQTMAVTFETRYAAHASTFGVETDMTTYNPLISLGPSGSSPTTAIITPELQSSRIGGLWNYAYRDDVTGAMFSSDRTRNADGLDHLIMFRLLNRTNFYTFVLAWEDMVSGDYDYNDAVFETTWTDARNIPEPASLALFGIGCLGAAAVGRRRRHRSVTTA